MIVIGLEGYGEQIESYECFPYCTGTGSKRIKGEKDDVILFLLRRFKKENEIDSDKRRNKEIKNVPHDLMHNVRTCCYSLLEEQYPGVQQLLLF